MIATTQTGYFNKKRRRYIYTEKRRLMDMAHFMFYGKEAYDIKKKQCYQELMNRKSLSI